ncbi:hypothetical protein BGZ63DRAFT_411377 [Mariannaea sp. PMI_226]|nr:hypothetical protein BGZ63DRAFT_411377 [Mariannaea sp. PMI_226]
MASKDEENSTIVIGLDFGTTFSGVAYARSPCDEIQIDTVSNWKSCNGLNADKDKAPTIISYEMKQDGSCPWGYDISADKVSLRWFKLFLVDDGDIPPYLKTTIFLEATKELIRTEGKTAVEVIADYLQELWQHALQTVERTHGGNLIQRSNLHVVATLPAIWPHYARLRMKSAIASAGILDSRRERKTTLSFTSEPEAAALASLQDIKRRPDIKIGDHIIICDAGGGTMDIITYGIASLDPFTVRESVKGDGKLCGGTVVDNAFIHLLKSKIPQDVWDALGYPGVKKIMDSIWEDWIKKSFCKDSTKWEFPGSYLTLGLPLSRSEIEAIHRPVMEDIVSLVMSQINEVRLKYNKAPKFVMLVGGFGKSRHLYDCLRNAVGRRIEVLQAPGERPWSAICRGAVLKGLAQIRSLNPVAVAIDTRISRASYGTLFNATPFDPNMHDAADRCFCEVAQVFQAVEQTNWFITIGAQVATDTPICNEFWQDLEKPDELITVDIVYSESSKPPHRKDSTVKMLCGIVLSHVPNWGRLPRWTNTEGKEFRRFHYELQMLSDGTSLDFSVHHKGKPLGCQNVAIKFMETETLPERDES